MIAVIDYGMGNIHSVQKALEFLGAKVQIARRPQDIKDAEKLVLPGVGAFDDAITELKKQNLIPALKECFKQKKPLLGICLGMQLLFEASEEAKKEKGLGFLKGRVRRFADKKGFKVPHIGWNQLKKAISHTPYAISECPLLKDVSDSSYVYFCHSYYPAPAKTDSIASNTDYGINFASVVWQGNLYGVQFHPEKSQQAGLKILENFINLC